ncbi:glycine--tRNA ligase subunit beta [Lysobacter sp. HDW10]|uniref:glycine--tRNA ligase subunit beta n=1 Tax=Lysobacter sp. HDW10 TaxID=2714936 RepID=UPI00140E6BD5|nr:glycine--tRNA ligase subunit beta [Lysobacter sp. HDW10]QIK82068.1 glycine--tRNA ligase subunit beta [Lysobacter sp. HDW10]
MQTQPLLIELGTEELPVKALPVLAAAFFDGVLNGLEKRGIAFVRGDAKPLYTPRRLAVLLPDVAAQQPEQHSEVLGPYLNIALDADGKPTKALEGFAAKAGIAWDQLERTSDSKGERFVHRSTKPGVATLDVLGDIVQEAIAAMPIPKPMRWGAHPYAFARPVHWLVVLLGQHVAPAEIFGVRAGNQSRGHRFMHPDVLTLDSPLHYIDALNKVYVMVDPDARRARIVEQVTTAAAAVGGTARIDADNLEQVNGLVEWPSPVTCAFESAFLAVPQEALIETMETNQKYFPVLGAQGKLTEHFIGIANIESKDPSEVRKGYERVIRPRFSDAKFFFDEDLKQGLNAMGEGLKTVTYQAKLGSVADKVERVAQLAAALAPTLGVDAQAAEQAARLAKNDLQSRMVNEFPELQGIAGRHYAIAQGESADIAAAVDEIYMPRNASDDIAPSKLGQVLAIAERLDTLAGGFAAGLKPTGNKDPFALRRNALGLARTLLEGSHDVLPNEWFERAWALQPSHVADVHPFDVTQFLYDRLRAYFAEKGNTPQQFESVMNVVHESLPDFAARLAAVKEFSSSSDAEALSAANKRIRNILRKSENDIAATVNTGLFSEVAESTLNDALQSALNDIRAPLAARDYATVLSRLAQLRAPVDAFFNDVMVNAEDPAVRGNRLALLNALAGALGSVAAIEHLSV